MIVRKAAAGELPAIIDLAFETFADGYPLRPSRALVENALAAMLFGDGYLRVADAGGQVLGFLAGIRGRGSLWSDDVCAVEMLFVVAPEHRRSRAAVLLLRDFIAWGRSTGCDAICVTAQPDSNSRVGRFYQRHGFIASDAVHILRL